MLNEFKYDNKKCDWDEEKVAICCPDPPPNIPDPPGSDCCANTWQSELDAVNGNLKDVTCELNHVTKHLDFLTIRYNRLKLWETELTTANDLAKKICTQLELIEGQLISICKNTRFTIKAVEILYCMIREFYVTADYLQEKYDSLWNCIKCLNNSNLNATQGIGKYLTDYGTALTAVTQTRDTLLQLIMKAIEGSFKLHRLICGHYGYSKIIDVWAEQLHCGIPCEEEGHANQKHTEKHNEPVIAGGVTETESFCLDPILHFPICNDDYFAKIRGLYEDEKKDIKNLEKDKTRLTKRQMDLQASKDSLTNALKEVSNNSRCS